VIFSKHSATRRAQSVGSHGESVEPFDQTVGLPIDDLHRNSAWSHLPFAGDAHFAAYFSGVFSNCALQVGEQK